MSLRMRYTVRVFRFPNVRTGEERILPEGYEPVSSEWYRTSRRSVNEGMLVIVAKRRVYSHR